MGVLRFPSGYTFSFPSLLQVVTRTRIVQMDAAQNVTPVLRYTHVKVGLAIRKRIPGMSKQLLENKIHFHLLP